MTHSAVTGSGVQPTPPSPAPQRPNVTAQRATRRARALIVLHISTPTPMKARSRRREPTSAHRTHSGPRGCLMGRRCRALLRRRDASLRGNHPRTRAICAIARLTWRSGARHAGARSSRVTRRRPRRVRGAGRPTRTRVGWSNIVGSRPAVRPRRQRPCVDRCKGSVRARRWRCRRRARHRAASGRRRGSSRSRRALGLLPRR